VNYQIKSSQSDTETHRHKIILTMNVGARGSVVVKALCYKPEGRGFDS
jgi:hypothetical protein